MMDDVYTGQQMSGRRIEMMQNRIMNRYDADRSGDISIAEAGDFGRMARNFTRIDANDDGMLSGAEIQSHIGHRMEMHADRQLSSERMNAMSAWMHMQDEQKVAAFDGIDTDGDGALTEAELTAAADAARAAEEAARLREEKIAEINRMDLDGDGRLSADELQAELDARMAAQNVATFDGLDTDGDGTLSDAELAAGIAAQTPPADTDAAEMPAADTDAAEMPPADADAAQMPVADTDASDMPDATAPDVAMTDPVEEPAASVAQAPAEETAEVAEPVTTPEETVAAAETAPVAEPDAAEPDTLSLIENVFVDMLEDNGQSVSMASLASMSQSLYAEAQDILLDQLEQAAEAVGEPDTQDDDQAAFT